jgi:S-formylglutathione hydrolase FrmB
LWSLTNLSLLSGVLPAVALAAGAVGGLWLLAGTTRKNLIAICIVTALTAILAGAVFLSVERIWRPFADPVDVSIYVALGVAVLAVLLVIPRIVFARRKLRVAVASFAAAIAIVLAAGMHINSVFAAEPTVGAAIGVDNADHIELGGVPYRNIVAGGPLTAWRPPTELPEGGKVAHAPIVGVTSGFDARDALIYLPPAYFADPLPLLPVLILLAGQPGSPQDWLDGGQLGQTVDDYARNHYGLAPVVVVADGTGSELANPLCMNSILGNAADYLAIDVPQWIQTNLQVKTDPRAWAIGGLSYGGTCALQLATNYPQIYPTFLNLSGQIEPTLGDRQQTVNAAFRGDDAAFTAVNPIDVMRRQQFSESAGAFVVGADDEHYRSQTESMYQAAKAAGMDVRFQIVPGGHSFKVWSEGLRTQLGWLGTRLGLTN